jgi:replicative DNA helicase
MKPLRIPPQNVDAEKALLGSILIRHESINEVLDIINAESFYQDKHRLVYKAMLELYQKRTPIDLLTLSTRLDEMGELDPIGGRTYLAELSTFVPSSANIRHYADIVRSKKLMRSVIEASEYVTSIGFDESLPIEEILERAEKKIYEATHFASSSAIINLKDALGEAWERMERIHSEGTGLRGVPTGFKDIDNKLSGLQPSDLVILAARPSCGKTALALDMARQAAAHHNKKVLIFSLEMNAAQLVDRMMAAEARVDAWRMRTGQLSAEDDFQKIRDSLDRLANAPIFIDDQPGNNILRMRSSARRLKHDLGGLDLIIVDYLQLMVPTQSRNSDNVVQQVTEISRSLKNLARELNVPVLALSQLSRAVEQRGGKPRLSDLRDSGSIEQDADVVMFIHREDRINPETDRPNIAEIMIEKHRNGPTGKVDLYFDDKKATFLSMEKSDFSAFETTGAGNGSGGIGAF